MVLVLRLRQLGNLALQEANSEIKVGEAVGVAPGIQEGRGELKQCSHKESGCGSVSVETQTELSWSF